MPAEAYRPRHPDPAPVTPVRHGSDCLCLTPTHSPHHVTGPFPRTGSRDPCPCLTRVTPANHRRAGARRGAVGHGRVSRWRASVAGPRGARAARRRSLPSWQVVGGAPGRGRTRARRARGHASQTATAVRSSAYPFTRSCVGEERGEAGRFPPRSGGRPAGGQLGRECGLAAQRLRQAGARQEQGVPRPGDGGTEAERHGGRRQGALDVGGAGVRCDTESHGAPVGLRQGARPAPAPHRPLRCGSRPGPRRRPDSPSRPCRRRAAASRSRRRVPRSRRRVPGRAAPGPARHRRAAGTARRAPTPKKMRLRQSASAGSSRQRRSAV